MSITIIQRERSTASHSHDHLNGLLASLPLALGSTTPAGPRRGAVRGLAAAPLALAPALSAGTTLTALALALALVALAPKQARTTAPVLLTMALTL